MGFGYYITLFVIIIVACMLSACTINIVTEDHIEVMIDGSVIRAEPGILLRPPPVQMDHKRLLSPYREAGI